MSPLRRRAIERRSAEVVRALTTHIDADGGVAIIKAPPGSGKTFTLLLGVAHASAAGRRVAIAAQTNAQADDICRRLRRDHPQVPVTRFASAPAAQPKDLRKVHWTTDKHALPDRPGSVVVSTTAKWSLVTLVRTFDVLFVDEAWQMAWADFMLLGRVAGRFVLIGDPGQIPPVVPIPVERWETSPRAPHQPAPQLVLDDPSIDKLVLELPACRRLPADAVELVRGFYDFYFDAWAQPGERSVAVTRARDGGDPVDDCLDRLMDSSVVIATLPTGSDPLPLEADEELARVAAHIAARLIERGTRVDCGTGPSRLADEAVGLAATHRVMNRAISAHLGTRSSCRVDTPERWQGLERPVMVVVHPLSGVTQPSAFDLETGRLCVMASRHQAGLVVVSRDHVPATLATHLPRAEQAVGRPDVTGRGHTQNLRFWEALDAGGHVVAVA
jgi:hypothetical protein